MGVGDDSEGNIHLPQAWVCSPMAILVSLWSPQRRASPSWEGTVLGHPCEVAPLTLHLWPPLSQWDRSWQTKNWSASCFNGLGAGCPLKEERTPQVYSLLGHGFKKTFSSKINPYGSVEKQTTNELLECHKGEKNTLYLEDQFFFLMSAA